jgi:hypothetical protein
MNMTRFVEEDFELGTFGQFSQGQITGGEVASIQTVMPFRGSYHAVFHCDGLPGTTGEMCFYQYTFPTPIKELYARCYALLTSSPLENKNFVTPFNVRWKLASGGALAFVYVRSVAGKPLWHLNYVDATGAYDVNTQVPVELGRYYCVELRVKVGVTDGAVELWIDGVKVASFVNIDNETGRGDISIVQIGERWSDPGNPAHDVYMDEIVLADEYVGPFLPPKPPSACFIATAAFGSPLAPQLSILRRFRDRCLPNPLVEAYYRISPPIADYISRHQRIKLCVRRVLSILIKVLR